MIDLSTLSSDIFQPLVGQTVSLRFHGGVTLPATIKSVSEQPHAAPSDSPRTAFMVLFTCPTPCDVIGGTADVIHPALGTVESVLLARTIPATLSGREAYFKLMFN